MIDRIGGTGGSPTDPPLAFKSLRLGDSTRLGTRVRPGPGFAVDLGEGATAATFALALSADGAAPAEVEFRVVLESGGQRVVIHRERLSSDQSVGWLERTAVLPAPSSAGMRLRFETEPLGDAAHRLVRPFWGSIALLGARPAAPPPQVPGEIENVIFISLDTLGAAFLAGFGEDLGLAPAIEALRRRGFSFTRAYSNYPSTRPSHATMLSGLYPRRHGSYAQPGPLAVPTLADFLGQAGWQTIAFTEDGYAGSAFGFDRGFDAFSDGSGFFEGQAAVTLSQALSWLERAAAHPRRFFLFVHTYEVHSPYRARDEATRALVDRLDPGYQGPHATEFKVEDFALAHNSGRQPLSTAELRRMRALYQGEINYLDRLLASFLEAVARLPFAARTLLVLTADHGDEFSEHGFVGHGNSLYDPALHVPLIFQGPGIAAGESDDVVQLADVAPTVLDLLGLAGAPDMDGTSLAPILEKRRPTARPAFAELRGAGGACVQQDPPATCAVDARAVHSGDFKLITSALPGTDRLYDLRADPGERTDVAAKHPEIVARLRSLLTAYDTDEPGRSADQPTAAPLDAETRERLRALGYTD